jgi:hypothetical protein
MSAIYEDSPVVSQVLVIDRRRLPQSFIFYFQLIFLRRSNPYSRRFREGSMLCSQIVFTAALHLPLHSTQV